MDKKKAEDYTDREKRHQETLRLLETILKEGSPERIKEISDTITAIYAKAKAAAELAPPLTSGQQLGQYLRMGRWDAGVSVDEVAQRSGLDTRVIMSIETTGEAPTNEFFSYLRAVGFKASGLTVKGIREKHRLTIEQAARELGIPARKLRRMEAAFDRGLRSLTPSTQDDDS